MKYRTITILAVAMFLIAGTLSAQAEEESPSSLTIAPVDVEGSYFTLELEPGESELLTVELANHGSEGIEAKSYASNAYSMNNGGFAAREIDEPRSGVTEWLDYSVDDFTLEADQTVRHSFTVSVPQDAEPGDYLTSLVIQPAEPVAVGSDQSGVAFNQILRQVIAVSIDVPGERNPELAINEVSNFGNDRRTVVRIGIENTGNQHLRPVAVASIETEDGIEVYEQTIEMKSVYAGTDPAVQLMVSPPLEPGDYLANLDLDDQTTGTSASSHGIPFTVEEPPEPGSSDTIIGGITKPRMPGDNGSGSWLTLIAMIGGVALLAAIIGIMLGRRRARANAAPVAPAPMLDPIPQPTMADQSSLATATTSAAPVQQAAPDRKPGGLKPLMPKRGNG